MNIYISKDPDRKIKPQSKFGMTANGAEGETRAQMEEVLGASVDDINVILNDLRIAMKVQKDIMARKPSVSIVRLYI